MRRVIFVDDAPEILKHLQRTLAPMQAEWTMEFYPSATAALAAIRETPVRRGGVGHDDAGDGRRSIPRRGAQSLSTGDPHRVCPETRALPIICGPRRSHIDFFRNRSMSPR
jgi:hypothetical protein